LIHILRTGNEYGVTLDNLQEVMQNLKQQLPPDKMGILDDICKLRRLEEQLERGEIGTLFLMLPKQESAH
jgi:hypothetical protein